MFMHLSGRAHLVGGACASLLVIAPCLAEQPPSALQGNSVVLNWSESRTQKKVEGGQHSFVTFYTLKFYFGNQGHIFSAFNWQNGRKTSETIFGVNANGRTAPKCHFEGNVVVCDKKYSDNGVRRITITFGDNFRSCSIDVTLGKKPGTVQKIESGEEILSDVVTSPSCTIQAGNVFSE